MRLKHILNIKNWRHHLCMIVLLLLCTELKSQNTNSKLFANLQQNKDTLIIEGDKTFPPFEYLDEKGEPAGMNVDLTKAIMRKLNITKYKIILKDWYLILSDYNNNKLDLIMGMMYTPKRAKMYKFGPIHGTMYQDVLYRRGMTPINSLLQLRRKKILVEQGSVSETLLNEAGFKSELVPINNSATAIKLLSEGHSDALICEHEMGVYLIYKLGISNIEVNDIGLPPQEYCFVSKNSTLLDTIDHALYELKDDGTYKDIYSKWNHRNESEQYSKTIYAILAILLTSAVILVIFNRLLQIKVNSIRRKLDRQNKRLALALRAGNIVVWGYNVKTKIFFNVECDYYPAKGGSFDKELNKFHPDDRQSFIDTIESLSRGDEPQKKLCFRMDFGDGMGIRYIENEFAQIKDKKGQVTTIIGTHHDITDSVLRQIEKEEVLRKYQSVFSQTMMGLEYYDKNGILTEMNDAVCDIFGIKDRLKAISLGLKIYENPCLKTIYHSQLKESVNRIIKVNFGNLSVMNINDFIITRRGLGILEVRIVPVFDKDKELECYIVSYKDVTEMHNMQTRLRENVRKTEYAIRSSNTVLWELDCKTMKCLCYNEELTNFDANKPVPISTLNQYVHPNDINKVEDVENKISEGANETISLDIRVRSLVEGDWHYCTIIATPFSTDINGRVTKYVGFRRDNTQLVKLNEDLRTFTEKMNYVLESSGIRIWEYNIKTRDLTVFSGINHIQEIIKDSDYFDRVDDNDKEKVIQLYERMQKGEIESFSNQRKLQKTPGWETPRYIIFNGIPLRNENGKITSYFGLRRDITDLIETQLRLENEKEKAQMADKLKSAFLANMSHEIRTPLNAIVGFSNLLQEVDTAEEKKQFIQLINTNSDMLLHLINDILDLSKIESGVIEMANEKFDMALCFEELSSTLRQRITRNNVEFQAYNPYHRCMVYSDHNRISQILTNFATNAIKYTPRGYIKMGYCYENNGLKLYVQDTGIGIAQSKHNRIFHRFEKLDDFAQGTGLGLSICKAITDTCKGNIGFNSKEGEGSTFWAWIPCRTTEIINVDTKESVTIKPHAISPIKDNTKIDHSAYSILVAEDDDSNYLLVQVLLKGYKLKRARNGQEAVELASMNHFDIILMDVKMPVMDGLTAIKHIRLTDTKTPIITLTAYAFDNDKTKALDAGSTDFITKPLKENELKKMLHKYLAE